MTDKSKSTQNNTSVKEYIDSLNDEQTTKDSHVLIKMMQHISGRKPKLWNVGTIGFDTYHCPVSELVGQKGQIVKVWISRPVFGIIP